MPMPRDPNDHLIRHLAESNAEISKSLYQVHGVVSSVHERLEQFIEAHASHVRHQEMRDDAHSERADEHSKRIDDSAGKILAFEAQIKLIVWVATFIGSSGLVAIIAMLSKLGGK